MLILTSNGITSEKLFDKIKELLKENMKSVALIPTASNVRDDKEFNVQRHTEIFGRIGLTVDIFDIAVQNPELLDKYDVIFLMGGNPFYLLNIMRKTNCKELFSNYLKNKIIIGASAGSLVLGPTLGLVYELHPKLNDVAGLTDFKGLGLTNLIVYSHHPNYLETVDGFYERMHDFENRTGLQVICINDGQAVFVFDEEIVVI